MKLFKFSLKMNQLPLYIALACLFPIFVTFLYVHSQVSNAQSLHEELTSIEDKITLKVRYQNSNRLIKEQYQNTDALFLHNHIEAMPLLQNHIEHLKQRLTKSTIPDDIAFERRLQTLNKNENKCIFLETFTETGPGFKQVLETLSKSVEIDNEDLIKILLAIEGDNNSPQNKPHMIITEAQLDRKKSPIGDFWNLSLKILRREYMHEAKKN
jgi:hypothetical protein